MTTRVGRLRDAKTSALLSAAERGSIPHIHQLSKDGWPGDVRDQAVVLTTVFNLLDEEITPVNPKLSSDSSTFVERTQPLQRVNALLEIVAISGRLLNEGKEKAMGPISRAFEGNVEVLLRWLNFWLSASDWILCYDPRSVANHLFVPGRATEIFSNVLTGCDAQLRAAMLGLPETIRFGLSLWNWVDRDGLPLYFPSFGSKHSFCPIVKLLYAFVNDPAAIPPTMEEVSNYTYKQHIRFLKCGLSRIEQWETIRIRDPSKKISGDSDIVAILLALTSLCRVPTFTQAFIKLNAAGWVMRLATKHPEWKVQGPEGTLSIKIADLLFFGEQPWHRPPYFQHRVVPQLIEAGALEAIIDDYISRNGPNVKNPFFTLTPAGSPKRSPLSTLEVTCVHRKTLVATLAAFGSLPRDKQWRDEEYNSHHRDFVTLIAFYARLWDRLPAERIPVCDNLNHHKSARTGTDISGKQCSGCGAKVYCSTTCQKEDWSLHKFECHSDGRQRIDCELAHAWPSHKFRVFLVSLLQQMIFNWEFPYKLMVLNGEPSADGAVLSETYAEGTEENRAKGLERSKQNSKYSVHFSLWKPPVRWLVDTVDELRQMRCTHTGRARKIYEGPRFSMLFDEFEAACRGGVSEGRMESGGPEKDWSSLGGEGLDRKPRLASLSLTSGNIVIYVLGRFVVERTQESMSVRLLNGYVSVDDQNVNKT